MDRAIDIVDRVLEQFGAPIYVRHEVVHNRFVVESLRQRGAVFVTQTTLSMDDTARVIDALRDRFPRISGPRKDDICYATQNRQDAVKELAGRCDLVLVVGSPNSSSSNRLREIAHKAGKPAYLIDGPADLRREWLEGVDTIGLTAGASAPEVLVEDVVDRLRAWGADGVTESAGRQERVVFALPKSLQTGT